MLLEEIIRYFDSLLPLEVSDISLNGLQVAREDGGSSSEIRKVAFAVDACMASFTRAVESGADLLVVHHGLFWGKALAVTGTHYRRLRYLLDHNLALYAAHLPLDMQPEIGNNAGIADDLGLTRREAFGDYHGTKIGIKGTLPEALGIDGILRLLGLSRDTALGVLDFGTKSIRSVGIISGGADKEVEQALNERLDLYVTGELSHQVYHTCLEGGINLIAGGHYYTETYGVKKLMDRLCRDHEVETVFVDVPTGL
jgi:dinuclear metal center YbgI/SA1388 family protein